MIRNLDVFLWGRKTLRWASVVHRGFTAGLLGQQGVFYFDRDFLGSGYDIAPLRASIHSVSVRNGLPVYGEDGKLFGGLPSFIADSLPDHWGNKVFNEWAKTRGISARNLSVLDRLAYIGRRGMGALEFLPPAAEDMEEPFKVEIAELYRLAQSAFRTFIYISGKIFQFFHKIIIARLPRIIIFDLPAVTNNLCCTCIVKGIFITVLFELFLSVIISVRLNPVFFRFFGKQKSPVRVCSDF